MGGSTSYKAKYHSDPYRSVMYAGREKKALGQLMEYFGRYRLNAEIVERGVGVGQAGIVDGSSQIPEMRFDYAIYRKADRKLLALVEVTGDNERDNLARILSEKVAKGIELWPVTKTFFMYYKPHRDKPRILSVYTVWKHGKIEKWLDDEKPYYIVELKRGMTLYSFVKMLKSMW